MTVDQSTIISMDFEQFKWIVAGLGAAFGSVFYWYQKTQSELRGRVDELLRAKESELKTIKEILPLIDQLVDLNKAMLNSLKIDIRQ